MLKYLFLALSLIGCSTAKPRTVWSVEQVDSYMKAHPYIEDNDFSHEDEAQIGVDNE